MPATTIKCKKNKTRCKQLKTAASRRVTMRDEDPEGAWINFKNVFTATAITKMSEWWNNEIMSQVRQRRQLWREYMAKKTQHTYDLYVEQKQNVIRMVVVVKMLACQYVGDVVDVEQLFGNFI